MSCTLLPIYWGSSVKAVLSQLEVRTLGNLREQTTKRGVFDFGDSDTDRYLWLAMPQSLGRVSSFLFGHDPDSITSLNVVFVESEFTMLTSGIPYYLYRSPNLVIGEAALEVN